MKLSHDHIQKLIISEHFEAGAKRNRKEEPMRNRRHRANAEFVTKAMP